MRKKVPPIRPYLLRAVDIMQAIYNGDGTPWALDWDGETLVFGRAAVVADELKAWGNCPDHATLEALSRIVWNSAVERRVPTTWLLKRFRPESALIALLFTMAEVPLSRLLTQDLSDNDFLRLTSRAAQLTESPLPLRMAAPPVRMGIRRSTGGCRKRDAVVVCDSIPTPEEIRTMGHAGARILSPGIPPEWR